VACAIGFRSLSVVCHHHHDEATQPSMRASIAAACVRSCVDVISIVIVVTCPFDGVDAALTHKISILPRDDLVDTATTSTTAAAPCKCGYEPMNGVPGNTCVACAPGSYSSGTKCLPCLAGTITPSSGSCSCQPCGAGTQSSSNATSCELCPVGTYSNDNGPCKQCPDGLISTTAGATSCKQCTTLLSQSCGVGSTQGVSCRLCPLETYGPSATSGCINCPAVRSRPPSESHSSHSLTHLYPLSLNREQQRRTLDNAHALHATMVNMSLPTRRVPQQRWCVRELSSRNHLDQLECIVV